MVQSGRFPGRSCSTLSTSLLYLGKSHHFRFEVMPFKLHIRIVKEQKKPPSTLFVRSIALLARDGSHAPAKTASEETFSSKATSNLARRLSGVNHFFQLFFSPLSPRTFSSQKAGATYRPSSGWSTTFFNFFSAPFPPPNFANSASILSR